MSAIPTAVLIFRLMSEMNLKPETFCPCFLPKYFPDLLFGWMRMIPRNSGMITRPGKIKAVIPVTQFGTEMVPTDIRRTVSMENPWCATVDRLMITIVFLTSLIFAPSFGYGSTVVVGCILCWGTIIYIILKVPLTACSIATGLQTMLKMDPYG